MSRPRRIAVGLGLLALVGALGASERASAITRTEALVRAKAFAFHPWTATAANTTASCNPSYQSIYAPGDYLGLPYDWGGHMTLFTFDQQIAQGYGAGSYPEHGILSCTAGLDCSGFVSQCWASGHYTTSSVDQISSAISQSEILPGDIFNDAGNHMAMYSHLLGSGEPVLYESVFYNVHLSMPGWSWVAGYVPRRYQSITGTTAATPDGTTEAPIPIGSFPFVDSRNTAQSMSDVLDGCGADPNVPETGPEYIYQLTATQPGLLTVSVQDDVGVDIDVHLYQSMNTNDCVARNDSSLQESIDCGTYYVVADTFAKNGSSLSGPFTLTVDFQPSGGQPCGAGPKQYQFQGGPAEPCAYPGNQSLPFCNPNLGADTCLYTSSSSFCSKPCASVGDCGAFPGGCCADIGSGEKYCLPSSQCGGPPPDSGVAPKPDAGGDPLDAGGSAGMGSGGASGFGGNGATSGSAGTTGVGAGAGTGGSAAGAGVGGTWQGVGATGNGASSGDSSGCSVTRAPGAAPAWAVALLGALALARRNRRRT